jgi:hypothetical protein
MELTGTREPYGTGNLGTEIGNPGTGIMGTIGEMGNLSPLSPLKNGPLRNMGKGPPRLARPPPPPPPFQKIEG